MFITTADNPAALRPAAGFMTWPGPRILCCSEDAMLSLDAMQAAEARYIVFEFLNRPTSALATMRAVIIELWERNRQRKLSGPLLFTCVDLPDEEQLRLNREALSPWLFEYALDPADGRLEWLALGSGIVENPLFLTYLTTLPPRVTEAQYPECFALIEKHLIGRAAS